MKNILNIYQQQTIMGNQESIHFLETCSKSCIKRPSSSLLSQSAQIQVKNRQIRVYGDLNFQKQQTYKKLQTACTQFCTISNIPSQYMPTIMRLISFNHSNVLYALSTLPISNRTQFIDQIGHIYLDLMDSLFQFLVLNTERFQIFKQITQRRSLKECLPFNVQILKAEEKLELINKGVNLLRTSKIAIVFMCGGSSSRFHFQDKFLCPLQLDKQTQLLAVLFKKLRQNYRAASQQETIRLPIFIMGNQNNIQKLDEYMKQNNFFNFNKENIYFSDITSLPILNEKGNICLNFQYNYLKRPKGSACYIEQICMHPKAFDILKQHKVEYLHFVGTQNLAESPSDPLFVGLTHTLKRQMAIKCTSPIECYENFDRILTSQGKLHILGGYNQSQQIKQLQTMSHPYVYHNSFIAMNSLLISINSLHQTIQTFNNNLHINGLYRVQKIKQNYYDFKLKRPVINQKCYVFQKDIKDLVTCSRNVLVLKVQRGEFIPIITQNGQHNVKDACEIYMKYKKAELSLVQTKNSSVFNNQFDKI